jgi:PPK2 family polyphosphate:nucleotide phosphotransferase
MKQPSKQPPTLLKHLAITDGKGFRLRDHNPNATPRGIDEVAALTLLADGTARLSALQERLYAQGTWSLLCVFQAMDAAGKDGTIKHVMSGVDPQGVRVHAFKSPGPEELAHDFLWRVSRELPPRGQIGIFNRSHYEEVLVARLHPEIIAHQHLPSERHGKNFWRHRLADIAAFERYLDRQGCVVIKFFLNISYDEQRKRLLARLDTPSKHWKIAPSDITERARWDEYMAAYEAAITATATPAAPWYVVPANNKWAARLVVVEAIVAALTALNLRTPQLAAEDHLWLAEARRLLEQEN